MSEEEFVVYREVVNEDGGLREKPTVTKEIKKETPLVFGTADEEMIKREFDAGYTEKPEQEILKIQDSDQELPIQEIENQTASQLEQTVSSTLENTHSLTNNLQSREQKLETGINTDKIELPKGVQTCLCYIKNDWISWS